MSKRKVFMNVEPFSRQNESMLVLKERESVGPRIIAGFTTKVGGFSKGAYESLNVGLHVQDDAGDVVKNRDKLAEMICIPLENWVFADQVHGAHIEKITSEQKGKGIKAYRDAIPQCDGLYTNELNIMLALCYADCVPLFFYAPTHQQIGIAHAGWKGTVLNIAGEMINGWTEKEGIDAKDIYVAIGPAIGSCCYQVDNRVIQAVHKRLGQDAMKTYQEVENGQYRLDLKKVNKLICLKHGIDEKKITMSQYCTSCDQTLFFSHRRDGGKTGRMLSFIGLKEG